MIKLNSKELRKVGNEEVAPHADAVVRQPLVLILENIYDTYNIGGLFRLSDALAVSKVYLCGDTETPPNNRIHKASCGTYKVVPWEYCETAGEAIEKFRKSCQLDSPPLGRSGFSVVSNQEIRNERSLHPIACAHGVEMTSRVACAHGVEMTGESAKATNDDIFVNKTVHPTPYLSAGALAKEDTLYPSVIAIEQATNSKSYTDIKPSFPLALVVGNESLGVTKETLDKCDEIAEIPMWGINKSLNVIISAGIVAYHFMKHKT